MHTWTHSQGHEIERKCMNPNRMGKSTNTSYSIESSGCTQKQQNTQINDYTCNKTPHANQDRIP